MSWEDVVTEAKLIKEHFMVDILKRTILDHNSFSSSIVYLLADHFATPRISADEWISLLSTAYIDNACYDVGMESAEKMGMKDLVAICERDPASDGMVNPFLHFKGFKALQSHRIAHILWKFGRKSTATAIQSRCSELFSVDIHPAALIGYGLFIDHGTGIVIGETAVVGNNCSFLHGVTLGSTGKDKGDRHPKVGSCCKIGSGSIVLKSLPIGVTAVGNPARIVGRSLCCSAGASMDIALNNVMNSKGIKYTDSYNLWGDGEIESIGSISSFLSSSL